MDRKMLRNVEIRGVHAAGNGPSSPPTPAGGPVAKQEISTVDRLRSRERAGGELACLFQQPDLENHCEPMRNRALPSVMAFVAQATPRRVLCYATANLPRDQAESMVPSIDPEQVRKLAGWGLTQNDIASFVGCSQSLISPRF